MKEKTVMRGCAQDRALLGVNAVLMAVFAIIIAYPLLFIVFASFEGSSATMSLSLLPKKWTLAGYRAVAEYRWVWVGYLNSAIYTALGTVIGLVVCILAAYPLAQGDLPGHGWIMGLFLFTMYFGGGLIPYYVTIMQLGMINTFWVMVIPGAISAYNVIVFKTFFMSIPEALRESASLDGAGHVRILFQIVLPLSKAVLATFALFSIVGYWNDYMTALLYLRDDTKYPIQLLMRRLLVLMDYKDASTAQMLKDFQKISTRTTKAAATIITVVPVLCVYPFMQKHFAKGVLVGSIKA